MFTAAGEYGGFLPRGAATERPLHGPRLQHHSARRGRLITSDEAIYMLDVCRETFYSIYNNAEIATF